MIELSKDQTPFRKDERQRILSSCPDVEIMTLGMRNGEVPVSEVCDCIGMVVHVASCLCVQNIWGSSAVEFSFCKVYI